MKTYYKPKLSVLGISINEKISSLNDWLTTNGLYEAGITTYLVNS